MDIKIFQYINNLAFKNFSLDGLAVFCATYLIFFLLILAVVLFFYWSRSNKIKVLIELFFAGAAIGLGYLFNFLISLFYFRPRPFAELEGVYQLVEKSPFAKSFPSDHAVIVFALAFAIFFVNKRWGILFLFFALLVGISRIYVGVHYPLDILFGALVGFIASFLVYKIKHRIILKNIIVSL